MDYFPLFMRNYPKWSISEGYYRNNGRIKGITKLTSYLSILPYRILAAIGLILLIASFLQPWIVFKIPLNGEKGYSLIEFTESISGMQLVYNLNGEGLGILYLVLILLIASLITSLASLLWIPASVVSGGSGLISAGLWILEMEILKKCVETQMPETGKAVSSFMGIGLGVVLAIAGSVIMIIAFVAGFDFGSLEGSEEAR